MSLDTGISVHESIWEVDEDVDDDYYQGFDQDEIDVRNDLIEEHKIEEKLYGRPERFDSVINKLIPNYDEKPFFK